MVKKREKRKRMGPIKIRNDLTCFPVILLAGASFNEREAELDTPLPRLIGPPMLVPG